MENFVAKIHLTNLISYIQGVPQNMSHLVFYKLSSSLPMQFCVEKCGKPFLYLKKCPRYQWFLLEFQNRFLSFSGWKYGQYLLHFIQLQTRKSAMYSWGCLNHQIWLSCHHLTPRYQIHESSRNSNCYVVLLNVINTMKISLHNLKTRLWHCSILACLDPFGVSIAKF